MRSQKSTLSSFLEDIDKLDRAQKLLEKIWYELGPYTDVLERTTRRELRDFFEFDDSE
jgi:hypothetical protein